MEGKPFFCDVNSEHCFNFEYCLFYRYSFLSLMSWDLRPDFSCPICKDSPNVVIFDATGLAFRRSYVPKTALDASPVQEQVTSGR